MFMKLLKILFVLFTVTIITNTAHAATIDDIKVLNSHEIELILSDDVTLTPTIWGDLKVLKDILVTFATRDMEDNNKVVLTLEEDLDILTNYNVLTIFGADGNIDFKTEKSLADVEIVNDFQPQDQWIVKVITVDERTLEVYFKNPVEDTDFEFKIFSENFVDTVSFVSENSFKIHLENSISSYSQYLLMVLSLENGDATNVIFDEELYNFETQEAGEVVQEDAAMIDEETWEEVLELEDIALNAAETPDTGAETWVLVWLTLLVNAWLFVRRKLRK